MNTVQKYKDDDDNSSNNNNKNEDNIVMEEEEEEEEQECHDYIFGYGSIMNTSTHAAWCRQSKDTSATTSTAEAATAAAASSFAFLPGQCAILQNSPYRRSWNFRSSTGFTALGLSTITTTTTTSESENDTTTTSTPSSHSHSNNNSMNGVLFRIPHAHLLADFDRREVGYDRVALQQDQVKLLVTSDNTCNNNAIISRHPNEQEFHLLDKDRIWLYVPQATYVALADSNHPILQSYVDVVLQGCLSWGGIDMCRDFITSTFDWSRFYYLNDIPHSRRPWIYRGKDYQIVDDLLQEYSDTITFVNQARKHPEDFAAHRVATDTAAAVAAQQAAAAAALLLHSSGRDGSLVGAWSLPQRNPIFVGRSEELQEIHNRLLQQQQQSSSTSSSSKTTRNTTATTTIAILQVAGMGGVGKTQLVAEYCHLHVHEYYGLVLWLRASSAESVAAGYRQFMTDCILQTTSTISATATSTTMAATSNSNNSKESSSTAAIADVTTTAEDDVKEMDNVIAEVKARLFRSKVPWLLVFDNLEDFQLLPKFLPNGGTIQGHHVIVTTRLLHAQQGAVTATISATVHNDNMLHSNQQQHQQQQAPETQQGLHYDTMILQCFRPEESIQLLCRAGGFTDDMQYGGASSSSPGIRQQMKHEQAAKDLAERLGHLPLALGMAAAYMHQCDVDCCEYLTRYVWASSSSSSSSRQRNDNRSPNGGGGSSYEKAHQGLNVLGHEAVSSSLSLSLQAIQKENAMAWEMLRLLSWLGPDQITKQLVRSLLAAKQQQYDEDKQQQQQTRNIISNRNVANYDTKWILSSSLIIVGGGIALAWAATWPSRHKSTWQLGVILGLVSMCASMTTLMVTQSAQRLPSPPPRRSSSSLSLERSLSNPQAMKPSRKQSFSGDIYQQTDLIWKILKSFSLLQVKEGKASMHRLLGQFLRLSQSDNNEENNVAHFNLCVCFKAILDIWSFRPELVDTWNDSSLSLEHVKTLVRHAIEHNIYRVEIAILAQEAGVFSAMALNRFEEAQDAIEQSLCILDAMQNPGASSSSSSDSHLDQEEARGTALHELGRIFRYQGKFSQAEQALSKALEIRNRFAAKAARETTMADARPSVASTLHELGVLEVKKHNLDNATVFLHQSLELRRRASLMKSPLSSSLSFPVTTVATIESDCASTLHQLAAVEVARKPPALDKAEALLKEALRLNMQIGQRAATLKQLARVAIRRGEFQVADASLTQALELYDELYGEHTLHINVAAVRFQQGALAFQCEQLDEAWTHFSECLRARRHVYEFSQGNHLEVSSVIHELGCVAFAQKCIPKAREMLAEEKAILDQLFYSTSNHHHRQRLLQARLTNLTWLRKCAKESGDEEEARRLANERSELKRKEHQYPTQQKSSTVDASRCRLDPRVVSLQHEVVRCRRIARKFALSKNDKERKNQGKKLESTLTTLKNEIEQIQIEGDDEDDMLHAANSFHQLISGAVLLKMNSNDDLSKRRSVVLKACDDLRDALRDFGLQVNDAVEKR